MSDGRGGTATATVSLTVWPPGLAPVSLFTASNTPAQTNLTDSSPLEVGVKFQSSVAGQITALKFYRSSGDTGSDLLDLWTSTGTNLASVTFTNTAASGWQTVNLSTPVSIAANTTYVASYHTSGFYVATGNFFATDFTSGVLTAPSTTTAGGNGVYAYGGSSTTGIFPTSTFGAANYWADVVFVSSASNTAPTAVADTADATEKGGVANGSGGSPATGNMLTNDTDPDAGDSKTVTALSFGAVTGTLGTALSGAHGSLVLSASGDFTYTVNETDAAVQALRQSTDTLTDVFSYTMRDTAGATSSTTLTVTIHGADDAPTLAAQTGSQNATVGSAFSLVLPAGTFTDVDAGDSLAYTATAADGSSLPAWLSFNAATRTFSGTPTTGDVGTLNVKVSATDLGGLAASETFNIAVWPPGLAPVSLFTASNTPAQTNLTDSSPLEVGVKFQSSVAGQITALKFYRSSGDTGSDLLDLWTSTGTNLASVTFTNTAASGWQTVNLSTPVSIAANTTYVASYHTSGFYVATGNFFATDFTSGVLTAPSTTTAGGNGVYAYGGSSTTGIFPTSTFGAANYWADVVFVSSASNTAPTAVADTADATEKGGVANGSGGSPATGNMLTNDTDPDAGDSKTVTALSFGAVTGTLGTALSGAHGSLVLSASGDFTYTVNETDAAVQALRQSTDTLTDVFSYTMRDTAGATSSTTLTVTIHGADDAPTLAAQTGSQNATVGSAFSLVLPAGTFTDVDAGDSLAYTATAADGSSLPAWLSFNAATRTFSGTPTTGDVGTLNVKVSATDLGGLAASETFNIVVTTTSNTVPTAIADTADATEKGGVANSSGGSPAAGNVLTNDTDPDPGDTKTVTALSFGAVAGTLGTALPGAHGSLVLSASGDFTYTVNETDAAVQALRQSTDTLTDIFSYTMRDTAGATSSTTLAVTIHGADDAPTISNLAVGAASISFVVSDPDNATLSLASPFASAFGNPSITSGATTGLTPSVRTTAVSGTLQVTDGSYTADVVGLYLGTSGNNTATAPNPTAPNAMYGFGGSDTLTGGAGADSIVGGAAADTLSGGAGSDTFYLANGDFVSGESIDGGGDADAIVLTNPTTVNFTSGTVSNVETLTGSGGNDTVTMSANQWAGFNTINLGGGTNVLNVVAGGDISASSTPTVGNVTTGNLTGTSGNDSITLTGAQLDAIIVGAGSISLGAGTDTINLTSTSADLNTLGATNASIQGVEAISAATAASGVTIMISGQTEGFTIRGSANNDTITGGSGADTMIGGTGNDTYVVANTGDIVTENAGEGIDTIQSSVAYTLSANVESLILTGTGNINGTGNALDNAITGNDGNNTLTGLGGADALNGGLGTDTATYAASAIAVNVSLATGLGHGGDAEGDALVNIENLTGSGLNDTLEGNGGDNVLAGGAGTDTLLGLAGNDVLDGGAAADTLIGSAGNDTLVGGAGADVLTGGADADTFVYNAIGDSSPTAADTITDFAHGTDIIDLSAIDANTLSSGNQTFAYFAQSMSVFPDGVSWFESNGNTIVQADVNGNATADLRIVLAGTNFSLSASDFRL